MGWWQKFMAALGIAQKEADKAFQKGEDILKDAGRTIDAGAHKASQTIKDVMKPVDELGARIGRSDNATKPPADRK